jgi:hypothetical protein
LKDGGEKPNADDADEERSMRIKKKRRMGKMFYPRQIRCDPRSRSCTCP